MGDYSQIFLQLHHVKQQISQIVDENTSTIEADFAKSQIDPQNIEQLLSFILNEYNIKQNAVHEIGALSLQLFQFIVEQMNEKKNIQHMYQQSEDLALNYRKEIQSWALKYDNLDKELTECKGSLFAAQLWIQQKQAQDTHIEDKIQQVNQINVEMSKEEAICWEQRMQAVVEETQHIKIQYINKLELIQKEKEKIEFSVDSLERDNFQLTNDILSLKVQLASVQSQNTRLKEEIQNLSVHQPPPISLQSNNSNSMISLESKQKKFLLRILSNQSLQCKELIETRTPHNKTSFHESLNRIKSIERMSSYSSFLNKSYSKEILKNTLPDMEQNKVSIGVNVDLDDLQAFSPTRTRDSDNSNVSMNFYKKGQERLIYDSEGENGNKTIKQFFRSKIVQQRIKKKIGNSLIVEKGKQKDKADRQKTGWIEMMMEKAVRRRIRK